MQATPGHEGVTSSDPVALALQAGLQWFSQGDFVQADQAFAQVLSLAPARADALHMRGLAQYQLGHHGVAHTLLQQAALSLPADAAVHSNVGLVLRALGRFPEALAAYDTALRLHAQFAQAWANRGNVLRDLGQHADAVRSYQQAVELQPGFAQAWHGMGLALGDLRRWPDAVAAFDRAIAQRKDYAVAYLDHGNALRELDRLDDALHSYDAALASKPDYAQAWSNRGVVLKHMGRFQEALHSYQQALAAQPDFVDAMVNCSTLLKEMMRLEDSMALNQRALALNPKSSGAHLNLAICQLLQGDFAQGFQHYEWRWKTEQLQDGARPFVQPLWLGGVDLRGQTVLLHAEQGLGDTLQFCRYATAVQALGARVILEVQPPLVALLQGLPGVDLLVARGQPLPAFDWHCPLLSLPLAMRTTVETVPAARQYLAAAEGAAQTWQARVGPAVRKRIGLVWSGRPEHKNDHNRSLPFTQLAALLQPAWEFHCLQKELRPADLAQVQGRGDVALWCESLTSFADTAALVACMDLVIAVDTSVAHLAAAMGKPVWLLLPFSPDWRWLIGRDDTPWYPTMRLFRQSATGDWAGVLGRVIQALGEPATWQAPAAVS
jgi:tetratricopeptide (TPR) repeat protein